MPPRRPSLTAVFVVPPVAALRGSRAGLVGYAAGVLGRAAVAARTGGRAWPDALAHPVSVLVLDLLMVRSVRGPAGHPGLARPVPVGRSPRPPARERLSARMGA